MVSGPLYPWRAHAIARSPFTFMIYVWSWPKRSISHNLIFLATKLPLLSLVRHNQSGSIYCKQHRQSGWIYLLSSSTKAVNNRAMYQCSYYLQLLHSVAFTLQIQYIDRNDLSWILSHSIAFNMFVFIAHCILHGLLHFPIICARFTQLEPSPIHIENYNK